MKSKTLTKIILGTALPIVAAGCVSYKHDNEVLDIVDTKADHMVLIRDLETGVERIISFYELSSIPRYLQVGDTVIVGVGGIHSDGYYLNQRVLNGANVSLTPTPSGIERGKKRAENERFESEQRKFNLLKRQMQDANTK